VKRHVVEILGALLLCLAAFFSDAAQTPVSLPRIEGGSVALSRPDDWPPDFLANSKLHIRWPQYPNLCVGLCTREESLQ
jgi:hypothetical protein